MTIPEDLKQILDRAAIPLESRTPQMQNLTKTLVTLLDDLEVEGWDHQPGRIYHVVEPKDDPIVKLAGLMPHGPAVDIPAAYKQGTRVPPTVFGLVIAGLMLRHLSFDEVLAVSPDAVPKIRAALERDGIAVNEETIKQQCEDYYNDSIIPSLPRPAEMPADLRAPVRTICAVLKDGTSFNISRNRNQDPIVDVFGDEAITPLGLPTTLYLFLHGLEPDGENPDPLQAVADFYTLQAIEKES